MDGTAGRRMTMTMTGVAGGRTREATRKRRRRLPRGVGVSDSTLRGCLVVVFSTLTLQICSVSKVITTGGVVIS